MSDADPPPILYEKAKSGRASCKNCGEGIPKDAPRVGLANPQHKTSYLWYHPTCSFLALKPPKTKNGLACKICKQKIQAPLINLGNEKTNISVCKSCYSSNFNDQVKSEEEKLLFYVLKPDVELEEPYMKAIRGELEPTKRPRDDAAEEKKEEKKEEMQDDHVTKAPVVEARVAKEVVKEEETQDPLPATSSFFAPKKKKAKANPIVVRTTRSEIPSPITLPAPTPASPQFKVVSWNVAGLRGLLNKSPDALTNLAKSTNADLICLQEHKLQDVHVAEDFKDLLSDLGYTAHWAVSTAKKGYSGVACFCLNSSPFGVPTVSNFPNEIGISEGRSITLQYSDVTITNVYTPNSGQSLERLDFRTETWDVEWLNFQNDLRTKTNKPVMWLGDLNVAHKAFDVWNEGAKHHPKQSGLTAEERAGFDTQLASGYFDAFRELHPTAEGHYSFWSARSKAREPNKGLRLDYFVCSEDMKKGGGEGVKVLDSYMNYEYEGSDHGPLICVLGK